MSQKIMVETSARHVHVTQETLETLFGKGHELTKKKDLSQPGQFACEEKVEVIGPKGSLKCSILGPVRPENQVELSKTDARTIGVTAPVRLSGDIKGSAGCTIKGPAGEVTVEEGVIVAKRHIHLTPDDTKELGVNNGDVVWVKIETADRKAILGDVEVRVSEKFSRAMHIDTDEANAISAAGNVDGEIVKI